MRRRRGGFLRRRSPFDAHHCQGARGARGVMIHEWGFEDPCEGGTRFVFASGSSAFGPPSLSFPPVGRRDLPPDDAGVRFRGPKRRTALEVPGSDNASTDRRRCGGGRRRPAGAPPRFRLCDRARISGGGARRERVPILAKTHFPIVQTEAEDMYPPDLASLTRAMKDAGAPVPAPASLTRAAAKSRKRGSYDGGYESGFSSKSYPSTKPR